MSDREPTAIRAWLKDTGSPAEKAAAIAMLQSIHENRDFGLGDGVLMCDDESTNRLMPLFDLKPQIFSDEDAPVSYYVINPGLIDVPGYDHSAVTEGLIESYPVEVPARADSDNDENIVVGYIVDFAMTLNVEADE